MSDTPNDTPEDSFDAARRLIDSVGIEISSATVAWAGMKLPATVIRRRRPEDDIPVVFNLLDSEVTISASDRESAEKLFDRFHGIIRDQKDNRDGE